MSESLSPHPKQVEVVVYSKDYCPYCVAAMNLLTQKGVGYKLIDVSGSEALQKEMWERAKPRRTVPQIFINGVGIGGFDDMKALDQAGSLESLLFPDGR